MLHMLTIVGGLFIKGKEKTLIRQKDIAMTYLKKNFSLIVNPK